MIDFKVVKGRSAHFLARVTIPRDDSNAEWHCPFEVETDFETMQISSIKCLDQGRDGYLANLPLQALLKLIEELKKDGYTL